MGQAQQTRGTVIARVARMAEEPRREEDTRSSTEEPLARREIPGGDHAAHTPGATGPTTRNVRAASEGRPGQAAAPEESDVNEQLVGRARLGDEMKRPLDQNNPTE
jgi:hypothetical protein